MEDQTPTNDTSSNFEPFASPASPPPPAEPSPTPPTPPKTSKLKEFFKDRKKVLLYVVLPAAILILLLVGLVIQGFIGGYFRNATAVVKVINEGQEPIENALVSVGGTGTNSLADGIARFNADLRKGVYIMVVSKTGYIPVSRSVTLVRGANDLGTVILKETPVAKVNFTLEVTDYVSEALISDAIISLKDIKPIYQEKSYLFSQVPLGEYELSISKSGYNSYTKTVVISEETKTLETISLVPTGVIVFESNRESGRRGIYTANYDGSSQKQLVSRLGDTEDYTPILEPNQRQLFFTSTRDNVKKAGSSELQEFLYVVGVDGKNLTKVGQADGGYATWSPDGRYLGYTNYNQEQKLSRLYTYYVASKGVNEFGGYDAGSFRFSSDAKYIAFTAKKEGETQNKLYLSDVAGQNIEEIDANTGIYGLEFTLEGKLRYTYYDATSQNSKYLEYDLASKQKTEVTAPAVDREGATLSPDKKLRAYVSNRDGKANVFVSDVNGKNEKQLTTLNKVVPGDLLWSKDSSFVMFNYRTEGESARYLVAANGSAKAKKIVDINLTYYY